MRTSMLLLMVLSGIAVAQEAECVETEGPPPPPAREAPLLVKALGGYSALSTGNTTGRDRPGFGGLIGAEYRFTSWLSLRTDVSFRPSSVSWDAAGLKLRAPWFLAPYVSAAVSLGFGGGRVGVGPVGAAGLDLQLGRHFLVELEFAYRVAPSEQLLRAGQLSAMAGLGWAFD
jgi:hypothetical protein